MLDLSKLYNEREKKLKMSKRKPEKKRIVIPRTTWHQISHFVETWQRMGEAYFMDPSWNSDVRRNLEIANSKVLHLKLDGKQYDAVIDVKCSSIKVKAKRELLVDGVKRNITPLKRLLSECVILD